MKYSSDVAFSPAVKKIQETLGSRSLIAKSEARGGFETALNPALTQLIEGLDMFYLGTSNGVGQPYIQYKGGAPGFLKVLDGKTLAWADFSGNRQYISAGNISDTRKAFIFLIDYMASRRVKLWGECRVVEDDSQLLVDLTDSDYHGEVERAFVFEIEAWDANCPQHIHKRFPEKTIVPIIEDLEAQIVALKKRLECHESVKED